MTNSAEKFANYLIWESGAVSDGSRNPSKAVKAIAARDAELKAQTAAMLEKIIQLYQEMHGQDPKDQQDDPDVFVDAVHALIPTDYAAALKERVWEAVREEAEWWAERKMYLAEEDKMRLATHRAAAGAPFTKAVQDKPEEKK